MQHYYASNLPGPDGFHELHTLGCSHMPLSKTHLGMHAHCETALREARRTFRAIVRCHACCPPDSNHRPTVEMSAPTARANAGVPRNEGTGGNDRTTRRHAESSLRVVAMPNGAPS